MNNTLSAFYDSSARTRATVYVDSPPLGPLLAHRHEHERYTPTTRPSRLHALSRAVYVTLSDWQWRQEPGQQPAHRSTSAAAASVALRFVGLRCRERGGRRAAAALNVARKPSSCRSEHSIIPAERMQGVEASRRGVKSRKAHRRGPRLLLCTVAGGLRAAHLHSRPASLNRQLGRLGPRSTIAAAVLHGVLRISARAQPQPE